MSPLDHPASLDRPSAPPPAPAITGVVDGDMHPAIRSAEDLRPYLSKRWWEHLQTYGIRRRNGSIGPEPYPKSAPKACRRDSWPEEGGAPGSSLALMQSQHLDLYGVEEAHLGPLVMTGQGELNLELGAALCAATNDWQLEAFSRRDKRLKAAIVVPYEDGVASAAEIERRADDAHFGQVYLLTRSSDPLGNRRYWPIYEAAERHGLPVAFHVFGTSGHPTTGAGWPSYYVEEGAGHSTSAQTVVTSLVIEGVFERFPRLKTIIIEGGFGWVPALSWRLDRLWARLRSEVPHLERPPSEYIKSNIWFTTQPMEEPADRRHLIDTMEWIGWDRLLFASDYPHWDFDDPFRAFPAGVSPERQRQICAGNARAVYRQG